jgi:hypothetical protein
VITMPIKRPMLSHTAVAAILDERQDKILQLFDSGRIAWVFNIARPRTGRRCARVATLALADYINGRTEPRTFDEIAASILPGRSETILATNIAKAFCCSATLIEYLFPIGERKARKGPASSRHVPRREVVRWLQARRIL